MQPIFSEITDEIWYKDYDDEYKVLANKNSHKGHNKNIWQYPAGKKQRRFYCTYTRQRQIMKNWLAKGMKDMVKATIEAGYTPKTANAMKVQKTQTWAYILEEFLPDDLVATRHRELLDKREYQKVKDKNEKETLVDVGPETSAVTKALDMAYKLKGAYKEDKGPTKVNTAIYNMIYDPGIKAKLKTFEDSLKEAIYNESTTKTIKAAPSEDGVYDTTSSQPGGGVEIIDGDTDGEDVGAGEPTKE